MHPRTDNDEARSRRWVRRAADAPGPCGVNVGGSGLNGLVMTTSGSHSDPLGRVEARADLVLDRVLAWRQRFGGLSTPGLVMAALWYVEANTPSLLPRPWWLQGLIAAICAVLGYAVGTLIGTLGHALARWAGLRVSIDDRRARTLLGVLLGVVGLFVLAFPFLTVRWQHYVSTYVGQDPPGLEYPLGSTLVALVTFAALITLWRLVADLADWFLAKVSSRVVRAATARLLASLLTVVTVVLVVDQVARPLVLAGVEGNADRVNRRTPSGKEAPTSPERSGGPGSPYSWESLGQDGATFVSSGPDAHAITAVTGRAAKEPIRAFVGIGRPLEETRDAVLGELDRTRAWERRAILVVTATSTGYINTWGCSSFEYLLDGDSAIASMAYSDLPSAFGLLTAREDPIRAGRLLLDGVRERVSRLPEGRRPKIYAMGESLGAYGGEGAFASPQEMVAQVDGAIWTGTPAFSANRQRLTAERAPGSTTIVPVVDQGRHVRFAGNPAQLGADEYGRALGAWDFPRVAYLQHPSDPVAWWSPDLLFGSPEWLRETRRDTPMAQMSWTPLVTFWQVTADMLVSNNVPGGFGHRYYGAEMVPAWAAVLGRDDLSSERREAMIDAVGRR